MSRVERPDGVGADVWEAALRHLADRADDSRQRALMLLSEHVSALGEIVRARVAERGGDVEAELRALVEALRGELNTHLDGLVRNGGV